MQIPSIERIARTINGPNDATHIGTAKLHELQDVRWGQLKSQEQASLLRSARYVRELMEQAALGGEEAGTDIPPPIPSEPRPAAPPPLPGTPRSMLPVEAQSPGEVLRLFRQFVNRNVVTWMNGAGDHHHPIWELVALNVEGEEETVGPDYAFIQPLNRTKHAVLVEQYVDMSNERAATERGG